MDTSSDTKTVDMKNTYNVLQHLETVLEMMKRAPDLNIQINDTFNFFYICMPFFKIKAFYENVFEEFYPPEHEQHTILKATIDMLMIRYKDEFEFTDVEYLTPEVFQMLLQQGTVLREEYEMFTGKKAEDTPPQMTPEMQAEFAKHGIDPNNIQIDPSKIETIHLDPSQMETIQMDPTKMETIQVDPTTTGSAVVDDAIKATIQNG